MAVPWSNLQTTPRVFPTAPPNILGSLLDGWDAGRAVRQQREAGQLLADYYDQQMLRTGPGQAPAPMLGNLAAPSQGGQPGGVPRMSPGTVPTAAATAARMAGGGSVPAEAQNYVGSVGPWSPSQFDMEPFRQAISSVESGGNYNILGPVIPRSGDRAYGRYQVMGANIPSWTEQALGTRLTPEQFLASPQAQDAVFDHIFGGYVQRYGPEGAARAWFTGSPTGTGSDGYINADEYVRRYAAAGGMGGQGGGGVDAITQNMLRPTPQSAAYAQGMAPTPFTDQDRAVLRAMVANPYSREEGMRIIEQRLAQPALGDPFTLSPGQVRFDAMGNPIASLPANGGGRNLTTVGGVIYDEDTGQWITPPNYGQQDPTALIQNYEYARSQGYPGSFEDFLRDGGAGGVRVDVNTAENGQTFPSPASGYDYLRDAQGNVITNEQNLPTQIAIPGSPQFREIEAEFQGAFGMLAQREAQLGVVDDAVNRALAIIETGGGPGQGHDQGFIDGLIQSFGGAAGWGAIFQGLPDNQARELAQLLTTIRANVGMDALNRLRESSTTGASGLGQVTEREHLLLQALQGSLDQFQNPSTLANNLRQVAQLNREWTQEARARVSQNYTNWTGLYQGQAWSPSQFYQPGQPGFVPPSPAAAPPPPPADPSTPVAPGEYMLIDGQLVPVQ